LRFGFTVGLGVLATLLLTQLDNFFIGTFVGIAMLGYYDRAYRMAKWPSTLLGSLIARTVFQTYARLQDDRVRLQKTVSMVLWIITTLALPIVLVIFIAAPDMISLLYGEEWLPATIFLRILVVFAFIQPLWENATQLFVAIGKPRLSAVLMWAQVITLAVCGLPLTLLWGALGTCVAVAIAFAVGLFLIHHHISSEIDVNIGRALAVPLLISMMTLMGYLGLNYLTSLNELPLLARFLLKSSYATITFFGLMFLLQPSSTLGQVLYIWKLATRRKG
jgi:O-antigen/teichoic acid export membrane protein